MLRLVTIATTNKQVVKCQWRCCACGLKISYATLLCKQSEDVVSARVLSRRKLNTKNSYIRAIRMPLDGRFSAREA
jgi:hypothetical protein